MATRIKLTKDLTALPVFGPNFSSGTEGVLVSVVGSYSLLDIPWKCLRESVRPQTTVKPEALNDSVYFEGEARVHEPVVFCNGSHLAYHGLITKVHGDGCVDIEISGVTRGRVRGNDCYAVIAD